jgi:hypothetical protein
MDNVQTGSGAYLATYPPGNRGFSPEVERPRRESDQSLPSSAKVKNGNVLLALPIEGKDLPFTFQGRKQVLEASF